MVSGAPVSAATTLQGDSHVTSFSISDTAAHVQAALDALSGDSKLSSIALTDSGTPSLGLSYTQYVNDAAVLAKITGNYGLVVSGAPVSAATTLQGDSHVTSFSISDTAAHVQAALDALSGDSKLSSIALTDSGTPSLGLTSAQYMNDTSAIEKIYSNYQIQIEQDTNNNSSANIIYNGNWNVQIIGSGSIKINQISNAGIMVGSLNGVAAEWINGSVISLGTLGGTNSTAYAINDLGQIVGSAQDASGTYQAFLYQNGTMTQLKSLDGASSSAATGINDNGQIVGISSYYSYNNIDPMGYITLWNTADTNSNINLMSQLNASGGWATHVYMSDSYISYGIYGSYAGPYLGAFYATLNLSGVSSYSGGTATGSITTGISSSGVMAGYYFSVDGNGSGKYVPIALSETGVPYNGSSMQEVGISNNGMLVESSAGYSLFGNNYSVVGDANFVQNGVLYNVTQETNGIAIVSSHSYVNGAAPLVPINSLGQMVLTGASSLSGDTVLVSPSSLGLDSPSLTFIDTPDAVTLGATPTTVLYALQSSSGIETIANFQYGLDQLNIDLLGAANSVLQAANTSLNGANAISIYSSADPTHGVVLTGVGSGMTASDLLANHLTFAGGHALIT